MFMKSHKVYKLFVVRIVLKVTSEYQQLGSRTGSSGLLREGCRQAYCLFFWFKDQHNLMSEIKMSHAMLIISPRTEFCKSEQWEDNSYNLPMGQSKLSYELTFCFISIENRGKQKSKNSLRVEINQLCDG